MTIQPAPWTGVDDEPFSVQLFDGLLPAVNDLARRRSDWDPEEPEILRRWFLLVWYSVQASVPLLECAVEQLAHWPHDEFTELLGEYYTLHALEEQGYDRRVLDDLNALGVGDERASLQLPDRHIADMVGSQYYLIRHYHPALLLGYIAFCGSNPRTCRFHAQEDLHHLEELCAVLDEVPPEPAGLRQAIVVNALRCVTAYGAALDSIWKEPAIEAT